MKHDINLENAKLALKHRLFVSGWTLSDTLRYIAYPYRIDEPTRYKGIVRLYFVTGIPVAVCCIDDANQVAVFVKKSYRRRGIGLILLNKTLSTISPQRRECVHHGDGIDGSKKFFAKSKYYIEPR